MKAAHLTIVVLFFSLRLSAQEESGRKIYLELEPLQFASSGFSVVGHYSLNERWQIGTNVFASELSDGFNGLVFDYDDGAIDLLAEQNLGVNLSLRYFLSEARGNKGWVVSLPIGYERWTLNDEESESSVDYNFWYLSPRIGYLWHPFAGQRFYVLGEAALIVPISSDGRVPLASSDIEVNSFIPLPGLGLGYRF